MLKKIIIIKNAFFLMLLAVFLIGCTTSNDKSAITTKQESEPNFKEAAELNVQLAIGYIKREQYTPARDKLEKAIKQNPEYVPAYKTLAYLYALLGLPEKAEATYENALDLKPNDSDLSNSYGAFLCTQGRYEEAQKHLSIAYSDPFYEARYLAESNAGSCYIKQNEYKKAETLLRASLRKESKLSGSLISMADVGIKTERYLMARAYIQRYHAIKPATAESLWIQIQAEKNLGAEDHYMKYARKLIKDFPDSDEAGWVEAEVRNKSLR